MTEDQLILLIAALHRLIRTQNQHASPKTSFDWAKEMVDYYRYQYTYESKQR